MQCLKEIRSNKTFDNLSIVIYFTSSWEKYVEETFINGANIYINKPVKFADLKEAIAKVVHMNWQYHTSNLDKENFMLRI